jgi:L-fuconolactonase
MIIDAHQHFWDPGRAEYPWLTDEWAPIRRRFGPEDLRPLLAQCGVDRTVLVQTRSSLEETREFLDVAARTPFIAGVVGWVDLTEDRVVERIAELKAEAGGEKLVGIRHQVHDEEDPAWLLRADVQRGMTDVGQTGLAFDFLVRPRELPAAHETVCRHPEMRFVIDHLAKPPIRQGREPTWDAWMPRITGLPNVYCKLSGLVTEADWGGWTAEHLRPYVERVLAWIGADRLVFGSDWPICLVAASYARVFEVTQELVRGLPPTQQAAMFGGNAAVAYGLSDGDGGESRRPPIDVPVWPTEFHA